MILLDGPFHGKNINMDIETITREMNETADTIESFNKGEVNLDEDELFLLKKKKKRLLKTYYREFVSENVIPLA